MENRQPTASENILECPDFEEIEVKNEPILEQEIEEEIDDEGLDAVDNFDDVDPLNYLKVQISLNDFDQRPIESNSQASSFTYTGKQRMHKCNICLKEYVDTKSIRRHLLRIHNIDPPPGNIVYNCPECEERFSDKSHMTRHLLKHTREKNYTCPIESCLRKFSRKEHLNRHLLKFNHEKLCGQQHITKEDEGTLYKKLKTSEIEIIDNSFTKSGTTIKKDMSLNGSSKLNDNNTNNEVLDTSKIEVSECKTCKKKFVHRSHLQVHMKTAHELISCTICNRNFSSVELLDLHMSTSHSKPKDDKANKFVVSSYADCSYSMNIKKCTEKYVCEICNRNFHTKFNLKKHKLHVHNIEPLEGSYPCVYCEKKFIDNYCLKRHFLQKHQKEFLRENKNSI